jgi:Ca2+-binding RTX toxin-like protein
MVEKGKDNFRGASGDGFLWIYGGADADILVGGGQEGRIYGGSGNDRICAGGVVESADYDVWGGSGNDGISRTSECNLDRAFGESGKYIITAAASFTRCGPRNDRISFADCGGVA